LKKTNIRRLIVFFFVNNKRVVFLYIILIKDNFHLKKQNF
jgi:hypothetical protein